MEFKLYLNDVSPEKSILSGEKMRFLQNYNNEADCYFFDMRRLRVPGGVRAEK